MKNPLIINIRCSCIEEYISIQRLHKEYTRQLRTGEIMSVFVGAELAVPGEYAVVDKLMEKGGQCRKVPAVAFCPRVEDIRGITKEFTKADFEEMKEEIDKRSVVMSGPQPDEEIALPQAVDGGVDAVGNPPLPESNPVTEPTHFAFEEEPVPDSMFKKVPETLTEPDFTQAAPSVVEESDDGWNGEDHNYTC